MKADGHSEWPHPDSFLALFYSSLLRFSVNLKSNCEKRNEVGIYYVIIFANKLIRPKQKLNNVFALNRP